MMSETESMAKMKWDRDKGKDTHDNQCQQPWMQVFDEALWLQVLLLDLH